MNWQTAVFFLVMALFWGALIDYGRLDRKREAGGLPRKYIKTFYGKAFPGYAKRLVEAEALLLVSAQTGRRIPRVTVSKRVEKDGTVTATARKTVAHSSTRRKK